MKNWQKERALPIVTSFLGQWFSKLNVHRSLLESLSDADSQDPPQLLTSWGYCEVSLLTRQTFIDMLELKSRCPRFGGWERLSADGLHSIGSVL